MKKHYLQKKEKPPVTMIPQRLKPPVQRGLFFADQVNENADKEGYHGRIYLLH